MRNSHGWREIQDERKREIVAAIVAGQATRGPSHAELDLTDRCNVACYFCNQQDTRTKQQVPIERALRLIDELADGGVKSVRLSGGGDPLFHKEILQILDHLAARGIVIDNLTTNGIALSDEVARRLVAGAAREVMVVSLTAALMVTMLGVSVGIRIERTSSVRCSRYSFRDTVMKVSLASLLD